MKILSIFFAVCGILVLLYGVFVIVRRGKPLVNNKSSYKTEEERIRTEKSMLYFGIAAIMQGIVILLVSGSMYFRIDVLRWIGLGLMLPLSVYWIKTLLNKKK